MLVRSDRQQGRRRGRCAQSERVSERTMVCVTHRIVARHPMSTAPVFWAKTASLWTRQVNLHPGRDSALHGPIMAAVAHSRMWVRRLSSPRSGQGRDWLCEISLGGGGPRRRCLGCPDNRARLPAQAGPPCPRRRAGPGVDGLAHGCPCPTRQPVDADPMHPAICYHGKWPGWDAGRVARWDTAQSCPARP